MELLDRSVDDLKLSTRARNCLRHMNCETFRDVIQLNELTLLCQPNFGRKSLDDLKEELGWHGLFLGAKLPVPAPAQVETPAPTQAQPSIWARERAAALLNAEPNRNHDYGCWDGVAELLALARMVEANEEPPPDRMRMEAQAILAMYPGHDFVEALVIALHRGVEIANEEQARG